MAGRTRSRSSPVRPVAARSPTDEVGIIWEPGLEISLVCLDETCPCHISPVRGLRFLTHARPVTP